MNAKDGCGATEAWGLRGGSADGGRTAAADGGTAAGRQAGITARVASGALPRHATGGAICAPEGLRAAPVTLDGARVAATPRDAGGLTGGCEATIAPRGCRPAADTIPDHQAVGPSTAAMNGRRLGRLMAAGALGLMLAACNNTGTGTGMTGGFTNPLAGMRGGMDPDLRGRMGGGLDTSGGRGSAGATAAGGVVDPFAGQGVSQPEIPPEGNVKPAPASTPAATTTTTASNPAGRATSSAAPASRGSAAPALRPAKATTHTVASGETAWSISRKYNVSINDLAAANSLPETMTVRTGQVLTIPAGPRFVQSERVTAPGAGSPTPEPPSASKPLPREATAPSSAPVAKPAAPDLGSTRTKASGGGGRFRMPVAGSIVRTYAKGRSEGIDISAPAGTAVKAAGSGTVAAITRDTDGVPIVVLRHDGQLMTVYAGLAKLSVAKGDKVSAGETLGTSSKAGVLHFEVRQGFESVDPEKYLR